MKEALIAVIRRWMTLDTVGFELESQTEGLVQPIVKRIETTVTGQGVILAIVTTEAREHRFQIEVKELTQ
jgi:hypothetical protein